jgi:hypothetical protein
MSELALGDLDAGGRWFGVRRHQVALAVAGVGLAGDGFLRAASAAEVVLGLLLLAGLLPGPDGLSVAELVGLAATYPLRAKWTIVELDAALGRLAVRGRSEVALRGYALEHRGRLDLSGRDALVAGALADLIDGLATQGPSCHVSLHVRAGAERSRTLLALGDGLAPQGWSVDDALTAEVTGVGLADALWLLERWRYVRAPHELFSVLRVRDFSAVPAGAALLERLQGASRRQTVSLHVEAVGGERARRLVERAVHRQRSDAALTHAAGFRQTARLQSTLERMAEREARVASGRALVRLAVYVAVRAPTLDELDDEVAAVQRRSREAGLRLERGLGRQAAWFTHQLPGGPGWR